MSQDHDHDRETSALKVIERIYAEQKRREVDLVQMKKEARQKINIFSGNRKQRRAAASKART